MPHEIEHDVVSIKEWLMKEPYLPKDLDDLMIRKFIHSCYGSLEKTKKCIDRFCTTRTNMSEVYLNRDPISPKIQNAFSITSVSTFQAGDTELLIHQLDDPKLEKFSFYDVIKSFTLQGDFWLRNHPVLPEGHVIVLDIKDYTLRIVPKVNVLFFRDFLIFLLEGMPVRVKHVHVVNCPSYYDKLYALVKPVLPSEICNIITFHPTTASLHKKIDKKYLPEELGGDAGSMRDQHQSWVKKIEADREFFLNDNMWKADLKKKKHKSVEKALSGTFRSLSID